MKIYMCSTKYNNTEYYDMQMTYINAIYERHTNQSAVNNVIMYNKIL